MLQEMDPGNQMGAVISSGPDSIDAFENLLPFTLTNAQRNAMVHKAHILRNYAACT